MIHGWFGILGTSLYFFSMASTRWSRKAYHCSTLLVILMFRYLKLLSAVITAFVIPCLKCGLEWFPSYYVKAKHCAPLSWINIPVKRYFYWFFLVLPPVLVPRHSEWPPMQPRLPPPYHPPQEASMPHNATFPSGFRQTPGENIPSPFRQNENYNPYEIPGSKYQYLYLIVLDFVARKHFTHRNYNMRF